LPRTLRQRHLIRCGALRFAIHRLLAESRSCESQSGDAPPNLFLVVNGDTVGVEIFLRIKQRISTANLARAILRAGYTDLADTAHSRIMAISGVQQR